jgi:hypothetical protein
MVHRLDLKGEVKDDDFRIKLNIKNVCLEAGNILSGRSLEICALEKMRF